MLAAINVHLVRTSMLETLKSQYILVAGGKRISEWKVLLCHALRNAAIPLITYIGLQFGNLIGGIVVIEQVTGLSLTILMLGIVCKNARADVAVKKKSPRLQLLLIYF
ncbi:MAG: hypothetical protein CENE_01159 [Candidatus Celerinatantimonas neptuna]|nr:MAG: hypothetical protein CENE_01159 [Candidatus Celerinatantimonas neptuna]